MRYEELHQRYGNHIASRVQRELAVSEFKKVEAAAELLPYLETRAETAHREFLTRLDNPFLTSELGVVRGEYMDALYRRWREAEDLAYLVALAEDVSISARALEVRA